MQAVKEDFTDLLEERRKDYDILWVSRSMKPLAPHKLRPELIYSRKKTIEAVLSNSKIRFMIENVAVMRNVPVSTIIAEANGMLEEMASKAHLPTVRWLGLIITKVLKRILISIRLNANLLHRLKHQMNLYQVQYVYAPTHRSYLDFILLSYILFSYDMALPNIASGMDFYRMKIVGEILRRTGAFYMRRTFSSDPLYKEIFRAYVNSIVEHSDRAIEFFIEGTRSRSQKTLPPKFGLLSTILDNLYRSTVPDIQFIPISISYDKPLEELLFVYELLGVPKPAESTSGLFRSLSILREPFAYGNVYLKIAPPISARDYMDWSIRSSSVMYPLSKLPSEITANVANAIVDSQKRNTVLTPFNLIALIYNERVLACSKESYTVNDLVQDYNWIKNIFIEKFNATVNPIASKVSGSMESEEEKDKSEVYESLQTHKDLIDIDSDNNLKLKSRHTGVSQLKDIKGHPLSEETLRIAVPTINLMIYVNPVFAHLSKSALAALCINLTSKEAALKRYLTLRSLFCNEFALPTNLNEAEVSHEWEELSEFLAKKILVQLESESSIDNRLHSILCNLLIPFIESSYIICKTLLMWNNSVQCTEKNIIKECQRHVEESLYQEKALIKHPYSLSLDIYQSLLSSLVMCGSVNLEKNGFYKPDIVQLEAIIADVKDILNQCSKGSYMQIASSLIPEEIPNLRAKL